VDLASVLLPPGPAHWLGTDELGRDVLSRLLHAAQSSAVVVLGASTLDLLLATLLGVIAGWYGKWFAWLVQMLIDLLWAVPMVLLVVLALALVGVTPVSLLVSLAAVNWVTAARVILAEATSARRTDYVRAARAFGHSPVTILFRMVLPVIARLLPTLAAFTAMEILALETGLAFLGLSLPEPTPTWGGMLAQGASYWSSAWWIPISAATLMVLIVLSLRHLSSRLSAEMGHDG